MQLNVNFAYGASVTATRQRNPRSRGFVGTIPVDIPELGDAEAPVALRVKGGRKDGSEYRLHGDRLYAPVDKEGLQGAEDLARQAADGWRAERYASAFKSGKGVSYGPYKEPYDVDDVHGPIDADPLVNKVLSTEFEARAAEVREAAARYVLVNGRLHAASTEPVYLAINGSLSVVGFADRNYSDRVVFRADEIDRAIEELGVDGSADARIEVLLPDAVRAPLPHLNLLNDAKDLLDGLGGGDLKEAPLATLIAYGNLRDAINAGRAGIEAEGDRADLAGVLSALQPAAIAYAKDHEDRPNSLWEWLPANVKAATERYVAITGADLDLSDHPAP